MAALEIVPGEAGRCRQPLPIVTLASPQTTVAEHAIGGQGVPQSRELLKHLSSSSRSQTPYP